MGRYKDYIDNVMCGYKIHSLSYEKG